ncbi:MAG: PCRF domain-containing protein, partial [Bdellovibrionota bacterium]
MFKKLEEVERRFEDLERKLQDPTISPNDIRVFSKEHADLRELVDTYRTYKQSEKDIASSKELMNDADAEMRAFAK